jgi:hypothetical protein
LKSPVDGEEIERTREKKAETGEDGGNGEGEICEDPNTK